MVKSSLVVTWLESLITINVSIMIYYSQFKQPLRINISFVKKLMQIKILPC